MKLSRSSLVILAAFLITGCTQLTGFWGMVPDLTQEKTPEFLRKVAAKIEEESNFSLSGEVFSGQKFSAVFSGEDFYIKELGEDNVVEYYRVDNIVYVYTQVSPEAEERVWIKFTDEDNPNDIATQLGNSAAIIGDIDSDEELKKRFEYVDKTACPVGRGTCYGFNVKDDDGTVDKVIFHATELLPVRVTDNTPAGKTVITFDFSSNDQIELPEEAEQAKEFDELILETLQGQ